MPTENKLRHATSHEPFQERECVFSAFQDLCSDAPVSQIQLLPFLTEKIKTEPKFEKYIYFIFQIAM